MTGPSIILASASPRRAELLESAGIRFQVVPGHIDETALPNEEPVAHVLRLAVEKATEVARREEGDFFVGADTIVLYDGEIMGKPRDNADAVRMLRKLSGVAHEVIALWLGHESPSTTHLYVEADLEMKRRAIETISPSITKCRTPRSDDQLLQFLEGLQLC